MAPKFQGQLSLFPAPHPPRTPSSIKAAREADARPKDEGVWRQYPYFTSGPQESEKAVVFLGGLTNGVGGVPYTTKLSEELGKAGWKLLVISFGANSKGDYACRGMKLTVCLECNLTGLVRMMAMGRVASIPTSGSYLH